MKIGVMMIFATDQTMPMHRLAPEVEARGFDSLVGHREDPCPGVTCDAVARW